MQIVKKRIRFVAVQSTLGNLTYILNFSQALNCCQVVVQHIDFYAFYWCLKHVACWLSCSCVVLFSPSDKASHLRGAPEGKEMHLLSPMQCS